MAFLDRPSAWMGAKSRHSNMGSAENATPNKSISGGIRMSQIENLKTPFQDCYKPAKFVQLTADNYRLVKTYLTEVWPQRWGFSTLLNDAGILITEYSDDDQEQRAYIGDYIVYDDETIQVMSKEQFRNTIRHTDGGECEAEPGGLDELSSLLDGMMKIYARSRNLIHPKHDDLMLLQQGKNYSLVNGKLKQFEAGIIHATDFRTAIYDTLQKVREIMAQNAGKDIYLRRFDVKMKEESQHNTFEDTAYISIRLIVFDPMPEGFIHDISKDVNYPSAEINRSTNTLPGV